MDQPIDFSFRHFKDDELNSLKRNVITAPSRPPPPLLPMGISSQVTRQLRQEGLPPLLTRAPLSSSPSSSATVVKQTDVYNDSSSSDDEAAIEAFNVFNLEPPLSKKMKFTNNAISGGSIFPVSLPQSASATLMPNFSQFQARNPQLVPVASMGSASSPVPVQYEHSLLRPANPTPTFRPHISTGPKPGRGPPNVVLVPHIPPGKPTHQRFVRCPYCVYKCERMEVLHEHILTHEPNVKWTCPYCPMPNQMTKSVVEKHIRMCHPGLPVTYIPFGVQRETYAAK